MKRSIKSLLVLFLGMCLGLGTGMRVPGVRLRPDPTDGPALRTTETGLALEAVRSMATLVTTNVSVSDVRLTELRGYTGGAKAVLILHGDVSVVTDLSKAALRDVDTVNREAVLCLPQPTLGPPRVDLDRTQLVTVESSGLWSVLPGNQAETAVTGEALRQAQEGIRRIGMQEQWARQARRQAGDVLKAFFLPTGWRVRIHWADSTE